MKPRTILLWCREPSWCRGISPGPFGDAVSLIPVFCFDPRESGFFPDLHAQQSYKQDLFNGVALLRQDLLSRGSNLLVANGYSEKLVPSIARVLQADEVVTFFNSEMPAGVSDKLMSFRSRTLTEVSFHLNMHSIGFRMLELKDSSSFSSRTFPPFPKINPGRMPSVA